ncbi:MAG: tetratricopeptide repeat protein [Acidobacteria bacterium]|nr:tetratricopeptide repeat protein [Acidobacteriota bacterium]
MERTGKTFFAALLAAAVFFFVIGGGASFAAFQDQAEEEETEYGEEEYNAWAAADKEPDLLKRGAMLLDFVDKYPESKLMPYINSSYERLLFETSEAEKYGELEVLAEQWSQLRPGELQTLAYLAKATEILEHDEKCVECYEKIYKLRPTGSIAYQIARLYKKMGNDDKYLEWADSVMMYPEYETDFRLRYEIMQFYAAKNDITKADAFARETIKAADLVKEPGEDTRKHLLVARHDAYHVIGVHLYDQKQFDEAIDAFRKAIEAERYAEGYYWIGMCEWEKKMVDEAIESFAKAEVLGGDTAPKAKERLEQLYKALHNDTTIGIEKVYRRAKEELGIQ